MQPRPFISRARIFITRRVMLAARSYFKKNPDPCRDSYLPSLYPYRNLSYSFACQIKRASPLTVRNGSFFRTLANSFTCLRRVYSKLFTIVFPLRAPTSLFISSDSKTTNASIGKDVPYINAAGTSSRMDVRNISSRFSFAAPFLSFWRIVRRKVMELREI